MVTRGLTVQNVLNILTEFKIPLGSSLEGYNDREGGGIESIRAKRGRISQQDERILGIYISLWHEINDTQSDTHSVPASLATLAQRA